LIVATNQPDVARGDQSRENVERMNAVLRERLPLDDIVVCYHDDTNDCSCRKPQPGLLVDAAQRWSIDLTRSFMVGDRWRDVEAGNRAGCLTVLVRGSLEQIASDPNHTVDSLAEATDWILTRDAVALT
jgi:D-glycero-D-manno-heptose 1,7-bisphosphate phosphatase